MNYTLYLDESGDHGLSNINLDFPVFVLCGVLVSDEAYEALRISTNTLKENIWGNYNLIFHSRDIRKCEKEFAVLFDPIIKQQFYDGLNQLMAAGDYTVIASAIDKNKYVAQYGRLTDDVYEIALSFIIERCIFWLDGLKQPETQLRIILERRGKREDQRLTEHFQRLMARGTGYVPGKRLQSYGLSIAFRDKKENINGLQLADLIAYPVARHVTVPDQLNPAYEVIQPKIYRKSGKQYGLKVFP